MRVGLLFVLLSLADICPASPCSYDSYSWNTLERRAVAHQRVEKSREKLTTSEIDAYTGCSVCEQDQRLVSIPPLADFKICRLLAADVEATLRQLIAGGVSIKTVTGYRVGRTRGDTDGQGNRTRFSNHSFGIALDINAEHNGLYDHCFEFNENCRLIRGGQWNPYQPGSLSENSEIVRALRAIGFKWGGRIKGRQKDFIHFSPSGY